MAGCTTIVQPCTKRQKWPKQEKNDGNKVTKTHYILQDKITETRKNLPKQNHRNTGQLTLLYIIVTVTSHCTVQYIKSIQRQIQYHS